MQICSIVEIEWMFYIPWNKSSTIVSFHWHLLVFQYLANLYYDVFFLKSKTTEKELPNMRRSENIVNPACYLASGDQCYAKGNTSDSEASDDLTLSSFLVITCIPINSVNYQLVLKILYLMLIIYWHDFVSILSPRLL